MSAIDVMLAANQRYAATFPGARPLRPAKQVAVVACMDSRLDLFGALGLDIGDAHLIRNSGGQVTTDVLRSLAVSQNRIGTREVVVIHHTDCGMMGLDDAAFRAELEERSGIAPPWDVPGFTDLDVDVRASVQLVRECPWLPYRDNVRGFIFDVASARITEVTDLTPEADQQAQRNDSTRS